MTEVLLTPRLRLRQWRDEDHEAFAAMGADAEVMRHFTGLHSAKASRRSAEAWSAQIAERGWGNWALELRESGVFIGFTGLSVPVRPLPCMPCVEIGWRLARAHWGQGLASEAAREALRVGFERLALDQIVSFTALINRPSRAVMERIGMSDSGEDFDHPAVPEGHVLRRHCLYRLHRQQWLERRAARKE